MDLPYQQVYFSKTWCTSFLWLFRVFVYLLFSFGCCFFSFSFSFSYSFLDSFSFKENKIFFFFFSSLCFTFFATSLSFVYEMHLKKTVNKIEIFVEEQCTNSAEIRWKRWRRRWKNARTHTRTHQVILRQIKRMPMKMVKMCYLLSILFSFFFSRFVFLLIFVFFVFGSSRFWESFYRKWIFIWCSRMYFNLPLMCVLNIFYCVRLCVLACCSLKFVCVAGVADGVYFSFVKYALWMIFLHLAMSNALWYRRTRTLTGLCRRRRRYLFGRMILF